MKRWIIGAAAIGSISDSLALVGCGSSEHVTRITTTEQTTTAAPVMDPAPAQSTTTTTTVRNSE